MSRAPLVLEYIFEGRQRGYNFTSPTQGYSEDMLRAIWRNAMPRGQGWRAEKYIGTEALKCFPVTRAHIAISQVTVTDQRDESNRGGIRRAVIEVIAADAYLPFLRKRYDSLSASIQNDAKELLTYWQRIRMLNRMPKKHRKAEQLVLTHPYSTAADWRVIEAVVLSLALNPIGPLLSWRRPISLTTLTLNHQEESALVGMPTDKTRDITKVPVFRVV